MEGATVTLTNAASGDRLLVNGSAAASGTLASGITWTRTASVVTLSGSFTKAQYAAALALVQFENTTDTPSATARIINTTVNDGTSNSNTAVTTITVNPVNDAPVDGNETNSVTEDTTLTVADGATGDLLNNATDVDGNTLTITGYTIAGIAGTQAVGSAVTIPGVGTITINANGSYSFVPAANYTGAIPVITYTVSDGNGGTDTSTLTLSHDRRSTMPPSTATRPTSVTEDTTLTVADGAIGDLLPTPPMSTAVRPPSPAIRSPASPAPRPSARLSPSPASARSPSTPTAPTASSPPPTTPAASRSSPTPSPTATAAPTPRR